MPEKTIQSMMMPDPTRVEFVVRGATELDEAQTGYLRSVEGLEALASFRAEIIKLLGDVDEAITAGLGDITPSFPPPPEIPPGLLTHDIDHPAPNPANWTCTIGEIARGDLSPDADNTMRKAVENAYFDLTGEESNYLFSGWGSELPERYRAVVSDREPDDFKMLSQLNDTKEPILGHVAHYPPVVISGKLEAHDHIEWIRRHVGQGAPRSWSINDFISLITAKLGEAVVALNELGGLDRVARQVQIGEGQEHLYTACAIVLDAIDQVSRVK